MEFWVEKAVGKAVEKTASRLTVFDESFDPEIRPTDERFGDFQANGPLRFLKRKKVDPAPWISQLGALLRTHERFQEGEWTLEISGPGFINFRFTDRGIFRWLKRYGDVSCHRLDHPLSGQTVVVDYSSPNTAKRMHVGHLRSMVIGEALQRLVRFVGAKVIRDNHLGDWGTQFGILIAMIKEKENVFEGSDEEILDTLESLYREGNRRVEEDVSFGERARQELVKLQHGDPFNETLWKKINNCSYATFQAIYDRMGVAFDKVLGESFYRHDVESVCRELQALGIAEEDQGALVVFHREYARYATQPFIVRKSDGASNYASTDLATARYRTDTLGAQVILNVTDGRQRDHFECLALTVEKWFKKTGRPLPQMHHVWFGMVQDVSGKAIKTRTGGGVRLHELLDEAVERAYRLIQIKSPDLSEEEKRRVAEAVGLGAIKYADLAQERTSNYVFDWEKMIGFDGNTAPYLLYAVARIYALFRKLGCRPQEWRSDEEPEVFAASEERRLARRLMGFPGILALTLEEFKPHWLCRYLFDLAGTFSGFYNAHKVMTADEVDRNRRLLLCQATLSTLECGLHLLGLETVEKM